MCHHVKYKFFFFISFEIRKKWPVENEDIWNFHASLTLNKGKLIRYFGTMPTKCFQNEGAKDPASGQST